MQMPMAWLVMEGFAIQVADPSAMSLTCSQCCCQRSFQAPTTLVCVEAA